MKRFLTLTIAVLAVAAAVIAVYRFNFRKSIPDAPLSEQVAAILKQNDCLVCHSDAPDLPFYATLPIIGPRLEGHVHRAARFVNLNEVTASLEQINEADLAKLEQAMLTGSMPITEYKLVHWGTGFNDKERSVLTEWMLDTRARRFATGLAATEFANEPVQPLIAELPTDPAKVKLGYKLYHDGRLSADGTISCAYCHPLDKGGMDNTRTSEGIRGQFGGVNAPTVYNAALNCLQFWDGRAATLAEQAGGPPVNPVEMGCADWNEICARLKNDKALTAEFAAIYPEGITQSSVTDAISEFEKTLLTPDSPFDKYLKGDKTALTAEQIAGYELFKEHDCATCHAGQALGGQSFEYIGIAEDYFASRAPEIPAGNDDQGRFNFTGDEKDMGRFKTPMLRNVALTAPYLHDGSAQTLDEAVKAMMRYQTGAVYTQPDVDAIVGFLETLTGENPHLTM